MMFRVSSTSSLLERVGVEHHQGPGPVQGLRDRRRLLQIELADPLHQLDDVLTSRASIPGTLVLRIELHLLARVVDVEVQAAALEGVGHLAGVVRGQEDQRHAPWPAKVPISGTLTV